MKLTLDHPLFPKFDGLSCRLSPENLCCDGEISRTEVQRRLNAIHREWKELEKLAGFPVSEYEVESLVVAKYMSRKA